MIISNNNIVNISRLVTTLWETTYSSIITWLNCFIQPIKRNAFDQSFDNQDSSYLYIMMTSWVHDIQMWDQVTDKNSKVYYVDFIELYDDLTWKHWEYKLRLKFD